MALAATTIFEVRSTGNGLNGSGWNPSRVGAGTDFSQQDAAQITVTDGSCAGNTTLTSATAVFTSAVVGNVMCLVVGGTVQGYWEAVAFVNATTVTLDRNGPNSVAITLRLGGASKLDQTGFPFLSSSVSGSKVWVRGPGAGGGDYTITVNSVTLDKANTNDTPYTVEGYTTTRGDNGRPTLTTSAASLDCFTVTGSFNIVKNLNVNATGGAFRGMQVTGNFNHFQNCVMQGVFPLRVASYVNAFLRCEITGATGTNNGVTFAGGVSANLFESCAIHGNGGSGVDIGTNGPQMFLNTAIYANGLDGIHIPVGGQGGNFVFNCVIWNNGRDGIRDDSTVAANGALAAEHIRRTIFGKNAGYDINYTVQDVSTAAGAIEWSKTHLDCNAFYTTGTGKMHFLPACPNDIALTASPFTSDTLFTLNAVAGAGALIGTSICSATLPDGNSVAVVAGLPQTIAATPSPTAAQTMLSLWREYTGERNSTVVPDATVYADYLDAGCEELNRRVSYHLTDSTTDVVLVANTQEYALPTDCVEIVWVEHNGREIPKNDVEAWRREGIDWRNQPAGLPRAWAMYGNKLVLLPAPSAAAVAAAASPVIRYVSTPRSTQTYGPEQMISQDWRVAVYKGVSIWGASYPDSPVAEYRKAYFEKRFDEEAALIAPQYAARKVAR